MKALLITLLTVAAAGPALAAETPFGRCRALPDAAARLACYDALPLPEGEGRPAAPKPEDFGRVQRPAGSELDAIESSIAGRFEGWRPGQTLRLANGQIWQIADDSSAALWLDNPKVRVRRGVMGAFFLEIEGRNQSPKVRRID